MSVFPSELWLQIMHFCEYKTITIMKMCCRLLKELAESKSLDRIMFREPDFATEMSTGSTPELRIHPLLEHFWWAGCGCPEHLIIRPHMLRTNALGKLVDPRPVYVCNLQEDVAKRAAQEYAEHWQEYVRSPADLLSPEQPEDCIALAHPASDAGICHNPSG